MPYLLTIARGNSPQSRRESLPVATLETALRDSLAVQMLRRDGWMGRDPRTVGEACLWKFQEAFEQFDAVRAQLADGNDRQARRLAFDLYRNMNCGFTI